MTAFSLRALRRIVFVACATALLLGVLPVSAQAESNPMDSWKLKTLFPGTLTVWHAVFVPRTGKLLVAVGGRDPSMGNELVEVNPATGRIGRHAHFGSGPHRIAVSTDGLVAYVAFNGTSAIAKIDLITFKAVQYIQLGNDPADGARHAYDIALAPGTHDTLAAVVFDSASYSPNYPELWLLQSGVLLPRKVQYGPNHIEFQNATTLLTFGYGESFGRYSVTPQGLVPQEGFTLDGAGGEGEMAGTNLAMTSGALVNPNNGTVIRTFATGGFVAPRVLKNRVGFVTMGLTATMSTIREYELSTGKLVGTRAFKPLEVHDARELVETSAGYAIIAYGSGLHLFGPDVNPDVASNVPKPPKQYSVTWQESQLTFGLTDAVWDPTRRLLFGTSGDDVVAVDPDAQEIVRHVTIGGYPGDITLDGLGLSLFVTQRETNTVTKIDLLTFLPTQVIPLGTVDEHPVRPRDITAPPGVPDTFAVVLRATDAEYDTAIGGVALFTLGVRAPTLGGNGRITAIGFASPVNLYGSNGHWIEMLATPLGVETVDETSPQVVVGDPWGSGFVFDKKGAMWADGGAWFEPSFPLMLGFLPSISGPIALDEKRDRVFQFDFNILHEFQKSTGKLIMTINVNGYAGKKLVLFGNGILDVETGKVIGPPMCRGLEATIPPSNTIVGTPGNDVIVGTPYNDAISGGGGNDIICGGGGDDTINGGPGSDDITGGDGNDTFLMRPGLTPRIVSIDGVANDAEGDNIRPGIEIVIGTPGADVIVGTDANETFRGGDGIDALAGRGGDDTLDGGNGADTCQGGPGDNTLVSCEASV